MKISTLTRLDQRDTVIDYIKFIFTTTPLKKMQILNGNHHAEESCHFASGSTE